MASPAAGLVGVAMAAHELMRCASGVVKVGESRGGREGGQWVYMAIGGWRPIIAERVVGEPRNRDHDFKLSE